MSDVWTDDLVGRLKALWVSGHSAGDIALTLASNLSRNAVIGKIHRLKLPAPGVRKIRSSGADEAPLPARAKAARRRELAPMQRRNPASSLAAKLAIAEAEPGLPEHLKGDAPTGQGIKLGDLTDATCHWPKGDPRNDDFEFCGARPIPGRPYCPHHTRKSIDMPRMVRIQAQAASTRAQN